MTSHSEGSFPWCLLLQAGCILTSLPAVSASCTFQMTNDGTHAHCNYRRINRLPATWPDHVTSLDASSNNLTDLHGLDVPQLAGLIRLDLSHNSISTVPHDAFQDLSQLQELDLSDNVLLPLPQHAFRGLLHLTSLALRHTGLHQLPDTLLVDVSRLVTLDLTSNTMTTVPTTAVRHVPGLETLMLGDNDLTEIVNHSFAGLTGLIKLDLSHNHLTLLQTAAFSGLGNLTELDLSYNRLVLNTDAYPVGVFSPLVSLHILALHGNDDSTVGTYNMPALTSLSSLRTLSIDTFRDTHFGQDFAGLTRLTTLDLTQNCRIVYLRNTTFQAFKNSSLEELHMKGCAQVPVQTCVFCNLPRLKVLRYVDNSIALDDVLNSLYGLQNQTLSLLDMTHNKKYYPTVLSAANMLYLNTMCIESISLSWSLITSVTLNAIQIASPFCECLKRFDLSKNQIYALPRSVYFKSIACFKNLEWLDVHDQIRFSHWSGRDKSQIRHTDAMKDKTYTIYIPSPLSYLNAAAVDGEFGPLPPRMHFHNGDSLITLDMSYIGVWNCETRITGLTSLRTFMFSGNDCGSLDDDMFRNMTSVRHLGLADLMLNQDYIMGHVTQLLSPLGLLEHLDLSNNDLHRLPTGMLRAQPRLQSLVLASNRFESVPVDLDQQTDLSLLDLSNNMLTTLLPHERRLLDALAHNHTVHVHLNNNPLSCRCAGLDFVRWLSQTVVRLDGRIHFTGYDDDYDDNGRDYPCMLQDESMSTTWAVMAEWDGHWRGCVGQTAFWAALVGLLLQILGLVLTFVISRNWTYVRYAWRVLRHLPLPRRMTFRKDIMLAHADRDLEVAVKVRDILQERQGVRVLLPYEEILPGDLWAETSLQLMDDSWKVTEKKQVYKRTNYYLTVLATTAPKCNGSWSSGTKMSTDLPFSVTATQNILLVVTKNFLQDRWAGLLVHHAECSITDTMPDRVLALFLEQPAQLLTPGLQNPDPARVSLQRLLRVVPDRNVFHVHKDAGPGHPLWERLTQLILHH